MGPASTAPVLAAVPGRGLSDRSVVALAAAAFAGARLAGAVPAGLLIATAVGVAVVAVLAGVRRGGPSPGAPPSRAAGVVLVLVVLAAGSVLGARAWAGLEPPDAQPVDGWVSLAGDPRPVPGGVVVDVRWHGRRVEARAYGRPAWDLEDRLAGEEVAVAGRLRPPGPTQRPWLARRHVAATLAIDRVSGWRPGGPLARLANGIRRTLDAGARSLPTSTRSLLAGFVVGDDRFQPPEVADDFRASGLTHLLAVSGQNVAFVLALAAPLIVRLGVRSRILGVLAVLAVFGTVTRWEPSVLRAAAMATVASVGMTTARPVSPVRGLALAVTGLILIDPLLAHSVGFGLSVGASAGIAVLAGPLTARLPGPRPLAGPLAVTLAAQAGVAPLLVAVFGAVPLASLPANVLAGPAAGPAMVWGLVAGLPAGVVGGPVADLLHVPTRLLVGWVATVARVAAAAGLPEVGASGCLAVAGTVGLLVGAGRWRPRAASAVAVVVCAGVVAVPRLLPAPPVHGALLARGAELWRDGGGAVVVADRPDPERLFAALRRHGVARIDLLVVVGAGRSAAALPSVLSRRVAVTEVLGPGGASPGDELVVGGLRIRVVAASPRLEIDVTTAGSGVGEGVGGPV